MPTTTTKEQDYKFISEVIPDDLLENALDFISRNFEPDDIFDEKDLSYWALSNGFVKEEEK